MTTTVGDSLTLMSGPMHLTEPFLWKVTAGFFLTLSLIVLCFAVPGLMAYRRDRAFAREFGITLERLQVLRIVMAICMVFAATMLAVARVISAEAITAIISGITGYVLGGLDKVLMRSIAADERRDKADE